MIPYSTHSKFTKIIDQFDNIYVIVSPPRCSSTAFVRVFWEQPSIRYYAHEPFEGTYFMGQDLDHVINNLRNPLDLQGIKRNSPYDFSSDLVIKEIPYQVGDSFPLLINLTKKPVVFLTRDPRQNIASRMAKKEEVGENPLFPLVETGWELIADQIKYCGEHDIPYVIVDAKDFRNQPAAIFKQVFKQLRLPFHCGMLSWNARPDVDIDNLNGDHHHLYQEVLSSTGIYPDTDTIPTLDSFPTENRYRDHVRQSLRIYERLQNSSARIKVPSRNPEKIFENTISPGD